MVAMLILSILFTTAFAASYKVAAQKNCNLQVVNVWVYISSTIAVAGYIALKGHLAYNTVALILGAVAGTMVFFATLTFFYHIQNGKLSASWTVISLSIGFPVLASIIAWHEHPSLKQIVGLVLIVVALVLFGRHEMNNEEVTE